MVGFLASSVQPVWNMVWMTVSEGSSPSTSSETKWLLGSRDGTVLVGLNGERLFGCDWRGGIRWWGWSLDLSFS